MLRIPVPLIVFESLEALYGAALAATFWTPVREIHTTGSRGDPA